MKAIRVALVSDAVLPFNKGGKETRIHYLTREFIKLGYQVDVYTMKWWKQGRTYEYEGVTYHALCRKYSLYSGNRRSIKQAILFGLSCFKLLRCQFDIIEVDHIPYLPLCVIKIICLLRRKALYATWHEVWGWQYWRQYAGRILGTAAYLVERFSVRLPDHIVAVSAHTASQLRTELHYRGPLSLVNNGIDRQHIATVKAARRSSDVIFAGRLLPHKHVDTLLEAIAELRQSRPDIRCTIIGDGPDMVRLKRLARQLGIAARVRFEGFMEQPDDVLAAMKASKVFVLPSSREGFGIAVLEAYACGLRVVTVNAPGNAARHLVSPAAGTVAELTPKALAAAIEKQLSLPVPSEHAVSAAADYDWRHSAEQLREVYAV
jgi:glycosyltransferase involved in cell wall biosynthesis